MGPIYLLLSALTWSTVWVVLTRFNEVFSTSLSTVVTYALTLSVCMVVLVARKLSFNLPWQAYRYFLIYGIISVGIILSHVFAIDQVGASYAVVLLFIWSLVAGPIFQHFLRGEKYRKIDLIWTIWALSAMSIFLFPLDASLPVVWVVMWVVSGVCIPLLMSTKQYLNEMYGEDIGPYRLLAAECFVAWVIVLIIWFVIGDMHVEWFRWPVLLLWLAYAIPNVASGYWHYFGTVKTRISLAVVIGSSQLVFWLCINYLFLWEILSPKQYIASMILFGVIVYCGIVGVRGKKEKL